MRPAMLLFIVLAIHLLLPTVLSLSLGGYAPAADSTNGILRYTRDQLWQLRDLHSGNFPFDLPEECTRTTTAPRRKRGWRGGVRCRVCAQGSKPPLPKVILANTRYLVKQLTELWNAVRYLSEYRESCLLCFTETWLKDTIDNSTLRLDCDTQVPGKKLGGGHTVRDSHCSEDIELLLLSVRPYYLPREFGQVFVTVVYIHPRANTRVAANRIYDTMAKLENLAPDAPKFVLRDFNGCSIKVYCPITINTSSARQGGKRHSTYSPRALAQN
ncbi:hypothetical protein N1851_033250 [Merluccius polli]|uniref:Uncharacterized protein n=1 Tax=Merluccius polli TaxID=89951 RepID=A0AA47NNT1_MERPO|nr:hypothetical protein N1851_033250 [Merluccius polli]